MAHGEPSTRVRVSGTDEIARLAAAFNDMSERRERLELARKTMTSDVAHELRTPLSNIRGWLEAVQDGLTPADDALVTSLLEAAAHLEHIVDDLQVLALAEAGALNLEITSVSVREVLAQVVKAHRASARAAGVRLWYESEDLTVDADPVRLRQIVNNLVSNAVRYTPRGGSVNVTACAEQSFVIVDVKDTGIGIEAADLRHVFDRFWRAEKSRTRQAGGSGLGLAITQRLAAALGGSVAATSAPGQGSTFTVRLPSSAGSTQNPG